MKGFSIVFAITFLACSLSQAGWGWNKQKFHSSKSPMVEEKVTSPSYCYDTGWEFSFFASGYWPEDTAFDNELGGGIGLTYFLGHNFGIGGDYMVHGGGEAEQVGHLNFIYRFPLGGECCSTIAPYVFGGPGVIAEGDTAMLWQLGGGVDWRFESWGCIGLFGDFSYNWVDQDQDDFTLFRAGVRVPF